ncbi:plasmid replication protein RepC [Ochrobactrum chromiisoli]|uniref:Plasmid replication protein RepC n=1 Tax=Ochrobactrum chromiisoli TaxID=2993941 RepID=A0ABT3QSY4_9HYPH|nr:plasmid replication protein RepC [Ochrobactrum chromiisoli]MCX2698684.1 plasmid replication protein RepC [Ochrobactrum chromiisoli]
MQNFQKLTSALSGRTIPLVRNSPPTSSAAGQGRGINRWALYKQLCLAKAEFSLNDRCLAVLSALLSFLPEDEMNEKHGLVVFPSNRQLSLRAHGMPESTLRRHLGSLVSAGIILRKDSPTRKRYAHKSADGAVELAFGFCFAPLLEKARDIAQAAERIQAEQRALRKLRDEVSIIRREIAALFNGDNNSQRNPELEALFLYFRRIVDAIPRRPSLTELNAIKAELEALALELDKALNNNVNTNEMSVNDAQIERRYIESLPESHIESNNNEFEILKGSSPEAIASVTSEAKEPVLHPSTLSLEHVLRTCPDICEYGTNGISSWREFHDATRIVSRFLGISQSAYQEAITCMGAETTSTTIAWILQKLSTIKSPGGYLRSLTQKARAGGFAIAELLYSGLKRNHRLSAAWS